MTTLATVPPELANYQRNENSEEKVVGATDGNQQLEVGETSVRVAPPGSGSTVITLPGVMESKGMKYFIWSDGNASGTVTIEEQGDSMVAFADVILTADKDYLLVENVDGKLWVPAYEVST